MKIEHLVVAVAGLGKRLRPLTLRCPKALVKVHGKPLLHYILEEAMETDIRTVIAVVSPQHKERFARYFKKVQSLFPMFTFHVKIQSKPLGNGHAVLQAASIVKNKPFAVRFPDDLLFHTKHILHSMIAIYEKTKAPLVLLQRVPKKDIPKYGVAAVRDAKQVEGGTLYRITRIVEKPPIEEAPSNLTAVGGFIFTADVMRSLKRMLKALPHHANDVLPWATAVEDILKKGKKGYGWEFPGTRLDCGSLEGFREAEEFVKKSKQS